MCGVPRDLSRTASPFAVARRFPICGAGQLSQCIGALLGSINLGNAPVFGTLMSSNQPTGLEPSLRCLRHGAALATALSLSCLIGCSVYDSSLLTASGASLLTDHAGGSGSAPAGDDGGGSPSSGGGATQRGSDPLGLDSAGVGGAGEGAAAEGGSAGRAATDGAGASGSSGATTGAGGNRAPHELAADQPALASSFRPATWPRAATTATSRHAGAQ